MAASQALRQPAIVVNGPNISGVSIGTGSLHVSTEGSVIHLSPLVAAPAGPSDSSAMGVDAVDITSNVSSLDGPVRKKRKRGVSISTPSRP